MLILFTFIVFGYQSGRAMFTTSPPYECGAHGRFEYCIDGIPGCVVGCHCHPGYYFDTDTKICEPNTKLTQDYRRHYFQEPTRVQVPLITSPVLQESSTISSRAIDDKIDEITNDADDLGDWLYNQFFKTIENQVINNTENDNFDITRRSGSGPTPPKRSSRRSHKYRKARKKQKKKKGLKNKLLRITEDDSLFDSSSGSSTDDSDTSSSSDSEDDHIRGETKNKGHGHKKILVVNKRPRPPLPSFIFLPNMETPYYPPIGLPPPPVPMYPMVPVPPMMAPPAYPPYPYPVLPHIHDSDEATTAAHTTIEHGTTAVESTTVKNGVGSTNRASTTKITTEPTDNDNIDETENATAPDTNDGPIETSLRQKHRNIPRQKLVKQLREKMKRKQKLQNFFANEYQGLEPPFHDIDMPPEFIPNKPLTPIIKDDANEELPPGLRGIDFKYLTQLIHRGNLNKTLDNNMRRPTKPPPFVLKKAEPNADQTLPNRRRYFDTMYINDPNNYDIGTQPVKSEVYQNPPYNPVNLKPNGSFNDNTFRSMNMPTDIVNNIFKQPVNDARNIPANNIQQHRIEETDDAYYTNLGRQIASMIRNIDGDREVNIQIEKSVQKTPESSIFNGNNHGSRSYWERSVRSPYRYMMSFNTDMNRLKQSNENLFGLENEVALAASTGRTLSLHELENVVSRIDQTKTNLINKTIRHKPVVISKTSFNVNLLPRNSHQRYNVAIVKKPVNNATENYTHNVYITNRKSNRKSTFQPEFRKVLLSDFRNLMPEIIDFNNTVEKKSLNSYTRKPIQLSHSDIPIIDRPQLLRFKNSILRSQQTTEINNFNNPSTNIMYKKKNNNLVINNKYHNLFINEKTVLPIRNPAMSNNFGRIGPRDTPSYFHSYLQDFNIFNRR